MASGRQMVSMLVRLCIWKALCDNRLMRWIFCLFVTLIAAGRGHAEEKVRKLEPRCLAIEPIALRSSVSRTVPGSRFTAIVPSREEELGIAHLTAEEFEEAGYTWKEFQGEGETAAARLLETINSVVERDSKGKAIRATLRSESHLTASVFLCKEFYARFSRIFGEHVVVLMPDHFTVYVFARSAPDFQEFGAKVVEEYNKAVWPCSREAFEIGPTGIRCIGAFDDGSEYEESNLPPGSAMIPMISASEPAERSSGTASASSPAPGTKQSKPATESPGETKKSQQRPAPVQPPRGNPASALKPLPIPLPPADVQPGGKSGTGNSRVPVRKRG